MEVDEHLQGDCKNDHIIILVCSDDEKEPVFACECEDYWGWKKDLLQSLVDLRAWKQAYKYDITLADPTPKKLPVLRI